MGGQGESLIGRAHACLGKVLSAASSTAASAPTPPRALLFPVRRRVWHWWTQYCDFWTLWQLSSAGVSQQTWAPTYTSKCVNVFTHTYQTWIYTCTYIQIHTIIHVNSFTLMQDTWSYSFTHVLHIQHVYTHNHSCAHSKTYTHIHILIH